MTGSALFRRQVAAALIAAGFVVGCGPQGPDSGKPRIASLKSKDWQSRVDKVDVLAEATDNRTLARIVEAMDDPHPRVREAAIKALARRKDKSVIPALAKRVKDSDEGVRIAAVKALQFFTGERAVLLVVLRMGAGSVNERQVVAETVAKQLWRSTPLVREKALQRLAIMVKAERPHTQQDAAGVLVATGKPAVGAILDALAAARPGSRGPWIGRLQKVLTRIGKPAVQPLVEALREAAVKPDRAWAAVAPLAALGKDAVAPLIHTLDWQQQFTHPAADLAGQVLVMMGGAAVSSLVTLLAHQRADRRLVAAELLQRIRSREAVAGLIALLGKEKDRTVLLAAVRALGLTRDAKAVGPILDALRKDAPPKKKMQSVQWAAYREALLVLNPPAKTIVDALKAKEPQVRMVAAQVAGGLKIAAAAAELPTLLKDPKEAVIRAAAMAAGELKAKGAVQRLRALADRKDVTIRLHAVIALGRIGDVKSTYKLTAAASYRRSQALQTAGMIALGRLNAKAGLKIAQKNRFKAAVALRTAAKWALAKMKGQPTTIQDPTLCGLLQQQQRDCSLKEPDADLGIDLGAICRYGNAGRLDLIVNAKNCKTFQVALGRLASARGSEQFVSHWTADNKQKRAVVLFQAGMRQGRIERWHKNGNVETRGLLHQGRPHGLYTTFWDNGKRRSRGRYISGHKDGSWKTWFSNGNAQSEGAYKHGKRRGAWTEWHENGQKAMTLKYVDGKLDGAQVSHHDTGQQSGHAIYVKGKRHGPWKTFHPDGKPRSTGQYVRGLRDGAWVWFHPNGKQQEAGSFSQGKKTGKWIAYDAEGKPLETCDYAVSDAPKCTSN
ncbi:MAG: HEAT repeat domain-containing protein [bacterium]